MMMPVIRPVLIMLVMLRELMLGMMMIVMPLLGNYAGTA